MNPITLLNQLNEIEHVKAFETESHTILVTNALANFDISLNPRDISDTNFVVSPTGDRVLRISMNQGGIIVTPDDYVFNVEQDEFIQVDDAPPMCSIVEMVNGLERYIQNPMPSDNMDNCVGLYYIHYYIINSARSKGFQVDALMDKLQAIGQEFGLNVCDVNDDALSAPPLVTEPKAEDTFPWDLPAHWHDFAGALRNTMEHMPEDQYLILQCKGSKRFVQIATQHRNIRVEASSNHFLSGRDALSAKDIKALRRLGWLAPTGTPEQATPERDPNGSCNYFLEQQWPVDFAQLATLLVKTLSVVMGVPHDGYIAYSAFGVNGEGDVSYPDLGIKREVTDPNLRMDELAERLLSVLQEASGCATLSFDEDGDVALDMAGQRCFVSLVGRPPVVRFLMPLLAGISSSKKLLEQLNQLNLSDPSVCHVWSSDAVFAVQDIPAWPLQAQHVAASLDLFSETTTKSAMWLQSEFGIRASVLKPSNVSH
jgi:hypothetical protein